MQEIKEARDVGRPLVLLGLNCPRARVPPVLAVVRRPPHHADQLEHHRGARTLQLEEGSRSSCGGRSPTCR